jgi:hypothetical protein
MHGMHVYVFTCASLHFVCHSISSCEHMGANCLIISLGARLRKSYTLARMHEYAKHVLKMVFVGRNGGVTQEYYKVRLACNFYIRIHRSLHNIQICGERSICIYVFAYVYKKYTYAHSCVYSVHVWIRICHCKTEEAARVDACLSFC